MLGNMGRPSTSDRELRQIIADYHPNGVKVSLRRVVLRGDYDSDGVYWGQGRPLWRASDDTSNPTLDTFTLYLRADDREQAKRLVSARIPSARFYR